MAKDLTRLPPVTFDHIDVTSLLKDIGTLKREIETIKSTYTKVQVTEELKCEISILRKEFEDRADLHNLTILKEGSSTPNSTVIAQPQPEPSPPCEANPNSYARVLSSGGGGVGKRPGRCARTKSSASSASGNNNNHTIPHSQTTKSPNQTSQEQPAVVRKQTNKHPSRQSPLYNQSKRSKNNQGKSTTVSSKIKVAAKLSHLFVTRFDKCTTAQDIKEFIIESGEAATDVELIVPYRPSLYSSFKITVPAHKYNSLANENFWPIGIEYRGYRQNRNKIKINSDTSHK